MLQLVPGQRREPGAEHELRLPGGAREQITGVLDQLVSGGIEAGDDGSEVEEPLEGSARP